MVDLIFRSDAQSDPRAKAADTVSLVNEAENVEWRAVNPA
jgi:hypothetical protein